MSSFCPHCGDTANAAISGNAYPCRCLQGVTRAQWCQRVVNHRRKQGRAMSRWVISEWLELKRIAMIITEDEYQQIVSGEGEYRQMRLL